MKKSSVTILIIYSSFIIGLIYFYFIYIQQLSNNPPILYFYNQENLGKNLRDLFMISLISPILGFFLFGIILSYIFCALSERKFFKKKKYIIKKKLKLNKKIKNKNKTIEYIKVKRTENLLKEVWKHSLYASVFAFIISYQILKIPNLVNLFVNDEYSLGEVNPLIYGYFAILPIMLMISSGIYSAIWLLKRTDLYISVKNEGDLIDLHNISSFYGNLLKNYTTVSTFLMIFLITWDYFIDLTNVSIDVPIVSILFLPAFIFLVSPIYFFPLGFLVNRFNPLEKKKKKRLL